MLAQSDVEAISERLTVGIHSKLVSDRRELLQLANGILKRRWDAVMAMHQLEPTEEP